MKKVIYIFCVLSILTFSCKDNKTDLSELEKEIESLKEDINKLQSVVALQNAYQEKKEIVSITKSENQKEGNSWVITFTDNTTVQLPESVLNVYNLDEETAEYVLQLSNGQELIFNTKEKIYPTGIVLLTKEIKFLKNTEVSIEFRINPSNAIFNYDVASTYCQIKLDMADASTYSYVTTPENCDITRIEQSKDTEGNIKEGQYTAYICDKGGVDIYKYTLALVLDMQDKNENAVQLSSSGILVERKKDSNLPVVVIRTDNRAEIKDKENWMPGTMTIDGIGQFEDYEGRLSIRGRGNSTWPNPKKPYAIKLDSKSEILGMPKHKRWVLLANYLDRTLIRNHIAFEIAKRTDLEWTPRGQFVEVMLNDIHLGNYYLCEHIKVDENRVNIVEMESSDADEERITGGYLLEFDRHYDEINKFKSEIYDFPVMIKDPDEEILTTEQFDYIRDYINSFEKMISAGNFVETREYANYIADTTFIDWWIVMELTYNHEAINPGSCYMYKDRNGVLKAGPVWDFDWGTFVNKPNFCAKEALWYPQFFKDPIFVSKVKERWMKFKPLFDEIPSLIEEKRSSLATSAELNDEMWSLQNSTDINADESMSFIDALGAMYNRYNDRLNWLDNQIKNM